MRRLLLIMLVVAVPALATEPNPSPRQREIVERILRSMDSERNTASIIDSMFAQLQQHFIDDAAAKGNDPDDIEEAKELFIAVRQQAAKVNFAQLLHDAEVRLYSKYFTESELADLAAFYDGPTGKKMVAVMPQLAADSLKLGMETMGPKIEEMINAATEEQERKHPWRRTLKDIRALATAVEAYQIDQKDETYPAATDLAGLKKALEGVTMSEKFPEKDMWGHAYEYVVSPDRKHYRIVSAGADGIFEWDSRKIDTAGGGAERPVRYSEHLEDDIIYGDGAYIQIPVQAKPKGTEKK